jgi:pimeloyl-ACP methyl ester carboxylesterase
MCPKLVTLETADKIELDGAWYSPPDDQSCRAASILIVHGLGWNFYRGPSRWLPPLFAAAGYPCLALNMRDHDLKEVQGFDLCAYDIAAGIAFLESHGSGEAVLLGHGYGCNKLLCYSALSGDRRPFRRILLTLGAIKTYRPDVWDNVLASATEIRGETLVVQGAEDRLIAAADRAAELGRAAGSANLQTVLLEGGDHYFNGRHDDLARCLLDWLDLTDAPTAANPMPDRNPADRKPSK